MYKQLLNSLLRRVTSGAIAIDYWGSERIVYGNGKPYFEVFIRNKKVLPRIFRNLTLGFSEAYGRRDIEVHGKLDQLWRFVNENPRAFVPLQFIGALKPRNKNRISKQAEYIHSHYDVGNDLFEMFLDKTLNYTCAYFRSEEDTLETAQEQKMDHVLRKLQLKPGMKLMDTGCGWGHLAMRAAEQYGVHVRGLTLSTEQHGYAVEEARRRNLDHLVSFEIQNFLELPKDGSQDRLVTIGMLEHVGRYNYRKFFEVASGLLKPGGIGVLHTMSQQTEEPLTSFMDTYIFPGTDIASLREVVALFPNYGIRYMDIENLRRHYARTMDEMHDRFEAHLPQIAEKHGDFFARTWLLYLASCSAAFRYGALDLSQIVYSKGLAQDYPMTRDFLYDSSFSGMYRDERSSRPLFEGDRRPLEFEELSEEG